MTSSERLVLTGLPVDLRATLSSLARGRHDPAVQLVGRTSAWWATQTPNGVGTLRLQTVASDGGVRAVAWGDGATWLLDQLPSLVGEHRRSIGLRVTPRSRRAGHATPPQVASATYRASLRSLRRCRDRAEGHWSGGEASLDWPAEEVRRASSWSDANTDVGPPNAASVATDSGMGVSSTRSNTAPDSGGADGRKCGACARKVRR